MEGQKIRQRVFPAPVEVENCTLQMCAWALHKNPLPQRNENENFPICQLQFPPQLLQCSAFRRLKVWLKVSQQCQQLVTKSTQQAAKFFKLQKTKRAGRKVLGKKKLGENKSTHTTHNKALEKMAKNASGKMA